jgi:GntR family transcriptional regulator
VLTAAYRWLSIDSHGQPSQPVVNAGQLRSILMSGEGDDLNRDAAEPLYVQLAALLRRKIERGELAGRVPSEPTLVQEYGVSRGTAGRAVQILVDDGLVRYSSGRGAFVIPKSERTPRQP